jgi:Leucine-rich repeat (LRR) protein
MTQLEEIRADGNEIKELPTFSAINLKILNLDRNPLKSLCGVENL